LVDGERREDVAKLWHVAHAMFDELVRTPSRDLFTAEAHSPAAQRNEAEHGLHERRLARSVRADDAYDLAVVHLDTATVEDVDARQIPGDELARVEERRLGHAVARRCPRYASITA